MPETPIDSISRRKFGRRAAFAGLATALTPSAALAQGRGGAQTTLPPQDQGEVDAKFADMVRKYGDRLTDDQKTRARGVLARHQRMLMRVREFPLENGDAPATELHLEPKIIKE
jgi:predicted component of type VI protein secretion system